MKDRYIQILAELSRHGIEQNINIRDVVVSVFNGINANDAHAFLEHMMTNKHIRFPYNEFRYGQYPNEIYSAITLEGSEYLTSFYLKEATLQSFKNQKLVNGTTWFISCVSIGIAVFFGLKSNFLETQVKSLQKRLDTIEKTTSKSVYRNLKTLDTLKKTLPKKK